MLVLPKLLLCFAIICSANRWIIASESPATTDDEDDDTGDNSSSSPSSAPSTKKKPKTAAKNDTGIDLDCPLSPFADAWRQLPAELYREFGAAYATLGPGFFAIYKPQAAHNADVVKRACGVRGDLDAMVHRLWVLARDLWRGLRDVLTGIEQKLETFLNFLAESLETAVQRHGLETAEIRASVRDLYAAVRSADAGYETNYVVCRANYMRALRRQINGMAALQRACCQADKEEAEQQRQQQQVLLDDAESLGNDTEKKVVDVRQAEFEKFFDKTNKVLVDCVRKYWRDALKVYHTRWPMYSAAFLAILKRV